MFPWFHLDKEGKPMRRSANIVIRASPEEKKRLEILAGKEGLTVSAWVRRLAYVLSDDDKTMWTKTAILKGGKRNEKRKN
jgi:hypothetical protein